MTLWCGDCLIFTAAVMVRITVKVMKFHNDYHHTELPKGQPNVSFTCDCKWVPV